jgi:hypothetical protein
MMMRIVMKKAGGSSGDGCYPGISRPIASLPNVIDRLCMVDTVFHSTDASIQPQYFRQSRVSNLLNRAL